MLDKPKFGSPCNGCGLCCKTEVCGIGKEFYGSQQQAPCPSLMFENGRYWCGFVLAEDLTRSASLIGNALGIGKGCDSDDEISEKAI